MEDIDVDIFSDVLRMSRAAFMRHHWGYRPLVATMREGHLDWLIESFCEGDVQRMLATCRKADNSLYGVEEREEMERALDGQARTINMPYCFCRGARALNAAAVDAVGDLVNDVEVGVYFSKPGGDIAEWHCDANHNITIQLSGTKEWRRLAGGDRRADSSRGMFDVARNRAEQVQAVPNPSTAETFSLAPGSVLYLPPGDWHRVVPVEGNSISVDVRLGHLTAAKWLCEALHASLVELAMISPPPLPPPPPAMRGAATQSLQPSSSAAVAPAGLGIALLAVGPNERTGGESSSTGVAAIAESLMGAAGDSASAPALGTSLQTLLARCCVPRPIPCEASLSDGLHRGARLEYLEARGFLAPTQQVSASSLVGVSSLIAMTLKWRDSSTLLVHLLGASSLTTLEYCRFSLLCGAELHAPLTALAQHGTAHVRKLSAQCTRPGRLLVALRCLLHANVLWSSESTVVNALGGDAAPMADRAGRSRKRGR